MERHRISLVVITRNRKDVLINNLLINLNEFSDDDEIIIVDGSDEDYRSYFFSKVKVNNVSFFKVKPGIEFQRNFGVKQTKCKIILFLDDDIKLHKNSVNHLRTFFQKNQEISAVTGGLTEKNEPSKIKQIFEKIFSRLFFTSHFGKSGFTRSGMPIIPLSKEPLHKAYFLRGGFSAYRSDIFANHSFDEFFNGYAYLEDTDFSLSIISKVNSVFFPGFSGNHDHLSTLQKDHFFNRKKYIENYHYIFIKHNIGNRFLFYWTLTGILIINLIKSISSFNLSYFVGTLKGILCVTKKKFNENNEIL